MTIFKFTEARIRDLPLGSGIHRDSDVKGLMCICHKTCKTFAVQSDVRREKRHVRTVKVKIGRADHIRLAEARNEARKLMATIQSGVDPTAGPESTGITLEQALKEHLKERELSDATVRNYQYHMDNYLGVFGVVPWLTLLVRTAESLWTSSQSVTARPRVVRSCEPSELL